MGILDQAFRGNAYAPRLLIYGIQGIGKSTLAATFPNPIFVQTEIVNIPLDPLRLPLCQDLKSFHDTIDELLYKEHDYKTVVIDHLSRLDDLVVNNILENDPKKGCTLATACGGYGAGYQKAAVLHKEIKEKLNLFMRKKIAVIILAHAEIKKYKSPESDDYDIYTIYANSDHSKSVYLNDADAVLFARQKANVIDNESGRSIIKSLNQRILLTGVNPVNVSKNRYNMPDEIPMNFESISKYIPFYKNGD